MANESVPSPRILLVEDDDDDAFLIGELLRESGFADDQTFRCSELSTALAAASSRSFDVVLADLGLPDSRGIETLARFREHDLGLPIIVLTGHDDDQLASQSLRDGAQDYLAKNWLDKDVLCRSIRYAMDRKRAENEVLLNLQQQRLIADLGSMVTDRKPVTSLISETLARLKQTLSVASVSVLQHLVGSQRYALRGETDPDSSEEVFTEQSLELLLQAQQSSVPFDLDSEGLARLRKAGLRLRANSETALAVGIPGTGLGFGVLFLEGNGAQRFSEHQRLFLLGVANILGGAVERLRNDREAQSSQESFRRLVENLSEGLVVVDESWSVSYANPSFEKLCALSLGEIIGQPVAASLIRADGADTISSLLDALRGKQDKDIEMRRPDGNVYWAQMRVDPLEYEPGKAGFVVSVAETTETRNLQQRFLHAQKMEAVGRLAGGISHDFNNLLTAINGYSELMLLEVEDDSLRSSLEEIRSAGKRAAALTGKLLTFSRQQNQRPKKLSLNELISDLRPLISRLIEEDVRFATLLGDDVPQVAADPVQVEQIIINLVVNARDAMPEGGKIRFATRHRVLSSPLGDLEPGSYAELEVRDDGVGISEDTMQHIFEPFFSTKAEGKGTGLGLSTVYGIVQQSGGHIEVESRVGEGTVFRILLPEFEGDATNGFEDTRPTAVLPKMLPDGTGETILVVEDDESVRRLFIVTLERFGYRVIAAGDGEQAFDMIADPNITIDLVVSDLVMPNMGGPELARRLAQRGDATGILFVTGYAREQDGLSELRRKYTVLSKPFDALELHRAVAKGLRERVQSSHEATRDP